MDVEGFKFTFYVKPFFSNNENQFSQLATSCRPESRARPVLAQLSNRPVAPLARPVTHHPENSKTFKTPPADSLLKNQSLFQQSGPRFRSSTQKPVGNVKLFPVIHYYRKPRGFTPSNILRQKLCL